MANSNQSISEAKPKQSAPAGCLVVFGGIFFLLGLFASYSTLVIPLRSYWSAQSWTQRPCVILTSELKEIRGDDSTTWQAVFSYRYQFGDEQYFSSQDNAFPFSGSRTNAQRRLDQLPVGTETFCWVNPRQPQQALLDRSLQWNATLVGLLIAIMFCGMGGGVAYLGWRQLGSDPKRGKRKKNAQSSLDVSRAGRRGQLGTTAANHVDWPLPASLADHHGSTPAVDAPAILNLVTADDLLDQQAAIPQRLKPAHAKLTQLLAVVMVCCIWNGVVGIFLWGFFVDPPFGNRWGRVGVGLFLLPFVLIGLLLLLGVVRSLLSLINPRITIALSSGAVPLGNTMDVAWEVAGGLSRLNKLSIYVVGQEWARYVQGTDTRTDQSPFACIEVVSTAQFDEIPFGTRTVTIPAETMHTFDQTNNKIQWVVRVRGHIAWWPDVEEDFPFRVTPPAA